MKLKPSKIFYCALVGLVIYEPVIMGASIGYGLRSADEHIASLRYAKQAVQSKTPEDRARFEGLFERSKSDSERSGAIAENLRRASLWNSLCGI